MNDQLEPSVPTREQAVHLLNGWVMLPSLLLLALGAVALFIYSLVAGIQEYNHPIWSLFVLALLLELLSFILLFGFFTLQPNEARVLVLFLVW